MPSPKAQKDLYELFASVESTKEAELLLKDLLTEQEREAIGERWQLIQALASGMTQRDVAEKCGVSISKITRGAHALQYGNKGFLHFLKKLGKKVEKYDE
jgi:TrpR family trp operon transcriptional repressor